MNIKTRLDAVKILPKNSPLQKPNYLLSNVGEFRISFLLIQFTILVWAEYHPVTILINSPLDVTNQTQVQRFWQLVKDFETLHHSKGENFEFRMGGLKFAI